MSQYEPRSAPDVRDYDPIHPGGGTNWRELFRRIWAPIAAAVAFLVKFSFIAFKFFGIFISAAAYALIWGWKFAVGVVLMLLVHEMGHFVEAKRQGLEVSLPRFIPFLGAYVLIKNAPLNPWRNGLVAIAGPAAGGLFGLVCYGIGAARNSDLFYAIAYFSFLLNLFNLIPIGILDGGAIWRAIRIARYEPAPAYGEELALAGGSQTAIPGSGRSVAVALAALYVGLAVLFALGMWKAHVPQHRL
ncbi:MAG: site-2 protease family protein [Actinomycetota bacterium]|nr:site-2 protease family protein [Actinomycetota bacterium]